MKIPILLSRSKFAISRLMPDTPMPEWCQAGEIISVTRTQDELSIICEERFVPPEIKAERGWRALKLQGPLDFSAVGIIADIAAVLAAAGVSLFVVSTYDTDYFLIKEQSLRNALHALMNAGYQVMDHESLFA